MKTISMLKAAGRRCCSALLLAGAICIPASPLSAAEPDDYHRHVLEHDAANLPRGTFVFADTEAETYRQIRPAGRAVGDGRAQAELVDIEGQPFTKAWRVRTETGIEEPHHAMLRGYNQQPIRQGDKLLFVYYHRTLATSSEDGLAGGRVWLVTRAWQGPWQANQYFTGTDEDGWQRSYIRFEARRRDYAVGELELQIMLADHWVWEEIEVGGIALLNFGPDVDLDSLPENPYILADYEGREDDAAWRREALARIKEIRKGDLTVEVVDAAGRPVPDATVTAAMTRHGFDWGAAASVYEILGVPDAHRGGASFDPAIVEKYQTVLTGPMFSSITLQNALKWGPWVEQEPRYRREWAMRALEWGRQNDRRMFGHAMHWGLRFLPRKLGFGSGLSLSEPDPRVRQAVLDHIRDIGEATAPYVYAWDVVNEHWGYNLSTRLFGREFAVELFKAAREATGPDVRLFWNEGRLTGNSGAYTREWAEYLLAQGAPLDGVGWQFHTRANRLPSIPDTKAALDAFDRLGLDIHLSEFDVRVDDLEDAEQVALQTDFIRDIIILAYSHPAVSGVTYWSWAYPAWATNSELVDANVDLTPAGETWKEWIAGKFWTDETATTDARGRAAVRGYVGDYRITAAANGRRGDARAILTRQGETVRIVLTDQ